MKTRIYPSVSLAIVFFFSVLGCKKESNIDKPPPPESPSLNEKVKSWYEDQSSSLTKQRNEYPLWHETRQIQGVNITPIRIGDTEISNNDKVYKMLLTTENSKGEIISGNYVYFIPKKNEPQNPQAKEMNLQIAVKGLGRNKSQTNINGAILKYDLNYILVEANNYSDGQIQDDAIKLIAKTDDESSEISSFAEIPCGVCVDWYLVTYDIQTGQILSEIYVYTECGHQGCEGGGGGGSSSDVPQSVYNALDAVANNATPTSQTIGITTEVISPVETHRYYTWKCLQGVGWQVNSTEKGVLTKVTNPQNNNLEWQFQSVTHSSHGVSGFYTLMTINPEVQNYNAVVGLYNFIVSFNLHVTYSLLFNGFPITRIRDYPCQNNFHINQGIE